MAENMVSGDKIVVDADELLKRIDRVRGSLDELSTFLVRGLTTKPPVPAHQRKMAKASKGQPFELEGFDINRIEWKVKGGDPAGPESIWCWAFSTDVEGFVHDEARPLLEAIDRYGPEVVVGEYAVKLSGRDNNLLSRRRIKK